MRISIRYQMLLPLLLLICGILAASVWSAASSAAAARAQLDAHMSAIASTVNAAAFPRSVPVFERMKDLSGAEFVLADADGVPTADESQRAVSTLPSLPPRLPIPQEPGKLVFDQRVPVDGKNYLYLRVPLRMPSVGSYLYILYPESLWVDAVWSAIRPALFLGSVGVLISLAVSWLLTADLARRLQGLEQRTRVIARGDFSPMELPRRDDELRDLAGSINAMAAQLQTLHEAIQRSERMRLLGQVSGGLAHQLRNAVAGAKLAVQVHHRECAGSSEPLTVALRQLALVEMHLTRFFDLGKGLDLRLGDCNLACLIHDTVALLQPQFQHSKVELRVEPAPAVTARGDPHQLQQVLLNLMTNALEAAGPGGTVQLRLGRQGKTAYVAVRDTGPGPGADIAPRMFEPFASGKREGVGLGLAVAKQIAEAHGGTLTWRRIEGTTEFCLTLPAVEPTEEGDGAHPDR